MKTKLFLSTVILSSALAGFCQSKGGDIYLEDFYLDYVSQVDLSIEIDEYEISDEETVVVFFSSNGYDPVELVEIVSGKGESRSFFVLHDGSGSYRLNIDTPRLMEADLAGRLSEYVLYAVLLDVQKLYLLEKRLYLTDREFYSIENIFDVLYKSGITPLTYRTIEL